MAFSSDIVKDEKTTCDKCKKTATAERPIAELIQHTPQEHNCIYICESCITKIFKN